MLVDPVELWIMGMEPGKPQNNGCLKTLSNEELNVFSVITESNEKDRFGAMSDPRERLTCCGRIQGFCGKIQFVYQVIVNETLFGTRLNQRFEFMNPEGIA